MFDATDKWEGIMAEAGNGPAVRALLLRHGGIGPN